MYRAENVLQSLVTDSAMYALKNNSPESDQYQQRSNELLQLDYVSELAFTSWSCELRRAAACVIQDALSSILTLWVTNS